METRQKSWGVVLDMISLKGKNELRYFLNFGLLIFLIVCCSSSDNDPQSPDISLSGGKISGTVQDEDGNAYPNTRIEVAKGDENLQSTTGNNGEYSVSTKGTGSYQVSLIPPLKTNVTSPVPVSVNVSKSSTETVNFVLEPQPVNADVIVGNADIFGELKNAAGQTPTGSQPIYAANVFDPPFGQLTAVKAPDGHHVKLNEWKQADGVLNVNCNGNKSTVEINLDGLIPDGTYTFWLNFLNKKISVGQPVNFPVDVVLGQPLGATNGTENIAIAGNDGKISVSIEHDSCILTKETGLVLVVIYHINGNTFGSSHIPDPEEISQLLFYFQ